MDYWKRREKQTEIERDGIVVAIDAYPGWKFIVRPLCEWNADYQRALVLIAERPDVKSYLTRAKAKGFQRTREDAALEESMEREAFARGCLADWSGVKGPDGKPLKFGPANATDLLGHFPDIYAVLRRTALDTKNFVPKSDVEAEALASGN